MSKNISEKLAVNTSHANIDAYYGPYTTLEEAYIKVPKEVRDLGLTIGVLLFKESIEGEYILDEEEFPVFEDGNIIYKRYNIYNRFLDNPLLKTTYSISGIIEYLWKKGILDVDLEQKVEQITEPTIIAFIKDSYNINPGDTFNNLLVQYNGTLRGQVSIYRNGSLIDIQPLSKGYNNIRLGLYDSNNEYNFVLNFSDIGGTQASITNNGIPYSNNEISFRLSVGTIIIQEQFDQSVNTKIINAGSNISFPYRVQYINSRITSYNLTAYLDNSEIPLGNGTYSSGSQNLLNYTLPNDLSVGTHILRIEILDLENVYETFLREYSFMVVDISTRDILIDILNRNAIYSERNILVLAQIFSGLQVSNVHLSYKFDDDLEWYDFNSTINLNEIKTYSILAPQVNSDNGKTVTLYVRWDAEEVQDSTEIYIQPYTINVSLIGLQYNFDSSGMNTEGFYDNYEWNNTQGGQIYTNNIKINQINSVTNGFINESCRFDGNFGVLEGNLFDSVYLDTNHGFTLELKYNAKYIGNLNSFVLKNEAILIGYDSINITMLDTNGNTISQKVSVSEDRDIHLTWVVDYEKNLNLNSLENIEDYLDFPASSIYINGSLCSMIPLGNKSRENDISYVIDRLRLTTSYGTYFNCGTNENISEFEGIIKAIDYGIIELRSNNHFYYNDLDLGTSTSECVTKLGILGLMNEVLQKTYYIINSQNLGVCDIKFFRFYSRPLKAHEVYENYKATLKNKQLTLAVPVIVFTTYDPSISQSIVNDLNHKNVLGKNDDGSLKNYASPLTFDDLLKMGLGEKSKQKTHFVYGRLLYYAEGLNLEEDPLQFTVMTSTLGTSSLLYPVKNFKTTLCKIDEETNNTFQTKEKNGVWKLIKDKTNFGIDGWSEESKFTLKCDYMESAHFNNTPTCSFYNDIIDAETLFYTTEETTGELVNKYNHNIRIDSNNKFTFPEQSKSPARKLNKYDAIKGFPCIVYAINSDPVNVKSSCSNDTYLGTYMFNLDKSADSLGFEIKDNNIINKYNSFPVEGVTIALRFTYVIDGEIRLFQALEDMLTFNPSKCVDITDEIITLSYEGKANVRYSAGTFYSHSEYSEFGYREYILQQNDILNMLNSPYAINISVAESGMSPSEFYLLEHVNNFLTSLLGENSIISDVPSLSLDPIYYIGDKDEKYTLTTDGNLTYTSVYLYNKQKWQNESSENSYIKGDFEDRWDYLLELDSLADKFKDSYGKIDWRHTWGDGKTWGWKRVIDWVGDRFSKDPANEALNISNYFNVEYCILYYLLMMVFGQVDNAGKNCMWDSWDGKIWYPRPYDLDSATGLNNSGLENIVPYAEINKVLSPSGSSNVYLDYGNTDVRYQSYTTSTSKFWNTFGKVFNSEISERYAKLRKSGIYNLDTILNYVTSLTTDKISPDYYNKDAMIKYIIHYPNSSEYYNRIHGNRIESFYLWMKARIVFCDSLYGYDSIESINLRAHSDGIAVFGFEVYLPQYIHISIGTSQEVINLFCCKDSKYMIEGELLNGSGCFTSSIALDKEIDIWGGSNIKIIKGLQGKLDSGTFNNATKLILLDASGSRTLSEITLTNCKLLLTLNLSGCTRLSTGLAMDLSLCEYIKDVNFSGCTYIDFKSVRFPTVNNLLNINFENSHVQTISLLNATVLKNLNITECNDLYLLNLINCNIKDLNLSGYNLKTIILDSCSLLESLDCRNTSYINNIEISNCNSLSSINFLGSNNASLESINLTGAPNLKSINLSSTSTLRKVLLSNRTYPTTFNVSSAISINLLNYGEHFDESGDPYIDCKNLSNVTNIKFTGCSSITEVRNIGTQSSKYETNTASMFSGCYLLLKLKNCYLKLKDHPTNASSSGAASLFYGCYSLTTFDNCVFDLSECSYFGSTFFNCDALSWSSINTNFMLNLNTTSGFKGIRLNGMFTYKATKKTDELPNGFFSKCINVTSMSSIFSYPSYSRYNSVENNLSIPSITLDHFKEGNNIIQLSRVENLNFAFALNEQLTTIPETLFSYIFPNVKNALGTFYSCTNLTLPDVSKFFKENLLLEDISGIFYNSGKNYTLCNITYENNGLLNCTKLTNIIDAFRSSKLQININSTFIPKSVIYADCAFRASKVSFDLNFNDDIFLSNDNGLKEVKVKGLFSLGDINIEDAELIKLPNSLFSNIYPNVSETSSSSISPTYGGSHISYEFGIFEGNKNLIMLDSYLKTLLDRFKIKSTQFSSLFKNCTSLEISSLNISDSSYNNIISLLSLFEGCTSLGILSINITDKVYNLSNMFKDADVSQLSDTDILNLLSNKPLLSNISGIFRNSTSDSSIGIVYKLDGSEFEGDYLLYDVSYAFAGSQLYGTLIPAKLFDYCRKTLGSVEGLFKGCKCLGLSSQDASNFREGLDLSDTTFKSVGQTIEDNAKYNNSDYEVILNIRKKDEIKGLLSDCINLSSAASLFEDCVNLGGKIPSTIFHINNDIVLYTSEDEEVINEQVNEGDIKYSSDYTYNNILNLDRMFCNAKINDYYEDEDNLNLKLMFEPSTFSKITGKNSGMTVKGMFAGIGSVMKGNWALNENIRKYKCNNPNGSTDSERLTGISFSINNSIFPRAENIKNMAGLFYNSSIININGAFGDNISTKVTNISGILSFSRINTVPNNLLVSSISNVNKTLVTVKDAFYGCSSIITNSSATIPDFTGGYYKTVSYNGSDCYTFTSMMKVSGSNVTYGSNNTVVPSNNVKTILFNALSAWTKNVPSMGDNTGKSYPISVPY